MWLFKTKQGITDYVLRMQAKGQKAGFVPTMGALHEGHLSLIQAAQSECDIVVCSIFVNPTQFNDTNDLAAYPVNIERDAALLRSIECSALFLPSVDEMYPDQVRAIERYGFGHLTQVFEGAKRPGHFEGMVHIVEALVRAVQPHAMYMGQKDYQQLLIVQSMLEQAQLNVELVMCPIIREKDGLAMSSRNVRLNEQERETAVRLNQVLIELSDAIQRGVDAMSALEQGRTYLSQLPQVRLEYLELADANSLYKLNGFSGEHNAVLLVAAFVGEVRLIDNILIEAK